MKPIDDDELVLYHWRDGLETARIDEIDAALQDSPALRARYATLQHTLALADALPQPAPPADFERRVWQRLQGQIDVSPAKGSNAPSWWQRLRAMTIPASPRWVGAMACAVLCVVAASFMAGRHSVSPEAEPASAPSHAMANRVLDRYVAAHLRATEGLLMTAVNGNDVAIGGDRELAAALVDSNRLYAQAATRAGNVRLATFLRQLEPVLIELANPAGTDAVQSIEGLRDYVRRTDLLFEVRATEASIDRTGKLSL
jgi:hypothetical protein